MHTSRISPFSKCSSDTHDLLRWKRIKIGACAALVWASKDKPKQTLVSIAVNESADVFVAFVGLKVP